MNIEGLLLTPIFYIYGSIPFAFIFTYFVTRKVIFEEGTRNVGVANTFMVGGLLAGFLTVAGEVSKAAIPLMVTSFFFNDDLTLSIIFILSALIGTNFSIFLKGKGGMGTTILIWALAILSPYSLILYFAASLVAFLATKDSYYSTIITHLTLPFSLLFIEKSVPLTIFGLSAAMLFVSKFNRSRDDFEQHNIKKRLRRLLEKRYVLDVKNAKEDSQTGAGRLRFLKKKGFRIPLTCVCTPTAYEEYITGTRTNVLKKLQTQIKNLIDTQKAYSLKLSANDQNGFSLAEQIKSFSDVKGLESIVKAVENIWQSIEEDKVAYCLRNTNRSIQDLKVAIIIQEAINPKLSGLVFTKNPVNGMDEIIVESVPWLNDALKQYRIEPKIWIYKWGIWREKPEDARDSFSIIKEVIRQARKIEKKYGKPVSLEWTYDGKHVYWLGLKELPKLKGINIYSNRLSKERLPGIIKPLIWSVNIPLVNSSWKRLFVELVGKDAENIDAHNMAKSFYYRAYFNMGIIGDVFELLSMPRESIELLMGVETVGSEKPKIKPNAKMLKYLPRMTLFALSKLVFSKKLVRFLTTQRKKYDLLKSKSINELYEKETLQAIEELFKANQESSYFIIVTQLLMGFYNMMLKRQLDKIGVDIEKIDFSQVTEKLRGIDPNYHLSFLHENYEKLPRRTKLEVQRFSYEAISNSPEDFKKQFTEFMVRFGHLSDSGNDFSTVQWEENPDLILKMIMHPRNTNVGNDKKVKIDTLINAPIKRIFLKTVYSKAAKYREYSERMSFLYSYGYALFRTYFLHLARLLVEKGFINEESDIFYLTFDEIRLVIKSNRIPEELKDNIAKRKGEITQYQDVVLPEIIYGDAPPVILTRKAAFKKLKGVPASRGYYEGKVKVVKGIEDFSKMQDEDVLVIPYSDVSWNPIFVKAKAVISESGGILSHCSIVAREYDIPAVVSVNGATELKDGTRVAVNGYNGEITIIE